MGINRSVLVYLSALFLIISLLGCREKNPKANPTDVQKAVSVEGVVVIPSLIENKINTTGTILANEEVEIRSEVSGRIVSINFQEGAVVKKGDLLVKINDEDLKAQLKKLTAEKSLAMEDVYRKTKLLELAAISQEEMDVAHNQLSVLEAEIELVKSQISKTEIFAPFSGQIGLRYASPGGFASPTMLIARMMDTDPVKIEFAVPEKYLGKIGEGTEISFRTANLDSTFTGQVYAVDPRIDPSTRSMTVRAKCSNNEKLIIPGAFARIEIIIGKLPEALVVPSEAIVPDIRGEKLFIRENGMVKVIYVTIGIRTERKVQISEGIKPGDTVITTGLLQLREKMKVEVRTKAI
jgi:membrane fusion protein (multidrug efflux system)